MINAMLFLLSGARLCRTAGNLHWLYLRLIRDLHSAGPALVLERCHESIFANVTIHSHGAAAANACA